MVLTTKTLYEPEPQRVVGKYGRKPGHVPNGLRDLTYTGGQDDGVVLADFLKYVKKNDFFSRSLRAYAPVSVSDFATLQFTINAYASAYTGIVVTEAMEQAFGAGQPWTSATAGGQIMGGHCIPLVGYDSQFLYAVTWGQLQKIEYSAWHLIAQEAWTMIFGEVGSQGIREINLEALEADITKLTT